MELFLKLSAALLPAVILLAYICKKDPHREPTSQLIRAILYGVAICIPVASVEIYVQGFLFGAQGDAMTLFGTTIKAFFVAAVPEEMAKLLVLWLLVRRNKHFDEYFDGIVYAVCVSLGFAAFENVAYVLGSEEGWVSTAFGRALLAVPGHYAFAIIMGYYYSMYHFVEKSKKNLICLFVMPVLAHGVYDSIAMSGSVNPIAGGISFFVLVYFCIKLQKNAANKVQDLYAKNTGADRKWI